MRLHKIAYTSLVIFSFLVGTIYYVPLLEEVNSGLPNQNIRTLNEESLSGSIIWTYSLLISTEPKVHSMRPAITIDISDNKHIVWEEYINSNPRIAYKKWNSTLREWSPKIFISDENLLRCEAPVIKSDSKGNVHVVWYDAENVYYNYWNYALNEWSNPELVSTESTGSSMWSDLMVDHNGNAYVVWQDRTEGTDYDIYMKTRDITTGLWSSSELISSESNNVHSFFPTITCDNQSIYIVWEEVIESRVNHQLFFRYKNHTSSSWSSSQYIVSGNPYRYLRPDIDVGDNRDLNLVFNSGTPSNIFHTRWNSNTLLWSSIEIVSTERTRNAYVPDVQIDDLGNLHVIWFDYSDIYGSQQSSSDRDIFYKLWNSSSSSWEFSEVISLDRYEIDWRPSSDLDSDGELHIVWHGSSNNYMQIFYAIGFEPSLVEELSFIISPNFQNTHEYGTIGNILSWSVADNEVSSSTSPTYSLYMDNQEIGNFTWDSSIPIIVNIDELSRGIHTFQIVVTDGLGEQISDTVNVIVTTPLLAVTEFNIALNISMGILIAFGVVMFTNLILRKKKNKKNVLFK